MKKFLKGLAIFILGIVLFVSASGLLFLIPLKSTFEKDTVKETITNLDVQKLVDENPEFKDAINEAFEPIFSETAKYGIDEEFVVKLIDTKEVKGFVGDIAGNIINYAITGKNQKLISNNEIENLVNQAINDINESGYYEINNELKEEILTTVKDKAQEYQDFIPETSVIGDNLNEEDQKALELVRFVLGNDLTLYLIISLIISILGIVILNYKKGKCIKTISLTILIASIISFVGTIIINYLSKLILVEIPFANNIIKPFIKFSLTLSIAITVLMIIILIVYAIIHKKKTLDNSSKSEA